MNIDLRIRRAQQRVHKKIDFDAHFAKMHIANAAAMALGAIDEAFEHQARSLGQIRRWRNVHARAS